MYITSSREVMFINSDKNMYVYVNFMPDSHVIISLPIVAANDKRFCPIYIVTSDFKSPTVSATMPKTRSGIVFIGNYYENNFNA